MASTTNVSHMQDYGPGGTTYLGLSTIHHHSATAGFLGESAQLIDVLTQALQVGLIIRALQEVHLPGKEITLVSPLGVEQTLLVLVLPKLLLAGLNMLGGHGTLLVVHLRHSHCP